MSLTSQIITAEFPDLDKVEALNREAFPEEERVPINEFLRYTNDERSHFFAFYNEEEFVGFAFAVYNEKCSMSASLQLCRTFAAMAMGEKSFIN